MRYPVEKFTPPSARRCSPHFTNLDRPVFCSGQPARDDQGGALRALLALLRARCGGCTSTSSPPMCRRAGGRSTGPRASAPRGSTSACSSATATTPSPRSAARTSPASGCRTCSPSSSSEGASPPIWSSPRATSPTTSRCRAAATATTATTTSAIPTGQRWTSCSRSTRAAWSRSRAGRPSAGRAATSPSAPGAARSGPRPSTCCRGLLPAATLSHVGIFASGQAYEQLLLRMLASPLPEARSYAGLMLDELKQVIPSFVSRVERPDRGGEWVRYLRRASRGGRARGRPPRPRPPRRRRRALRRADPRGRQRGGPAGGLPVRVGRGAGAGDPAESRCARTRSSGPSSCRSSPASAATAATGRAAGWEALRYRFEIVSDYGGFRDLQRHRMLTCQWQRLGPDLGAGVPEEVREAGAGDEYERALEISRAEFDAPGRAGPRRRGAVRALPRLPHPLRPRPQRARGDAPDRAALRPRGPPHLPSRRPGDARADRRRPSRGRARR